MFPTRPDWIFAFRTVGAALVALAIAFALGLPEPQWSITAVFIVAQPYAGMVLAKGIYRVIGTLVGALAAVAMVHLVAPVPWLFLLVMAAWMAACTFASTLLRDVQAYGAVLSGYTATLIAFPAMAEPELLTYLATSRVSEIALGIACTGVASALVMPRPIRPVVYERLQKLMRNVAVYCAGALSRESDATLTALHRQIIADIGDVDQLRRYAVAEAPVSSRRNRQARHLLAQLLAAMSVARTLHRHLSGAPGPLEALLKQASNALETVATSPNGFERGGAWLDQLSEVSAIISARQAELLGNDPDSLKWAASLARLGELIEAIMRATAGFGVLVHSGQTKAVGTKAALAVHRDMRAAWKNAARVTVPVIVMGALSLVTGSIAAMAGVVIVTSIVGLFGNRLDAVAMSITFLKGVLLAAPLAFIYAVFLLPAIPGEWLLMLALSPVLLLAALGMAKPGAVGLAATGFVVFFLALVAPRAVMVAAPNLFFENTAAALGGLLLCAITLKFVLPPNPRKEVEELILAMRGDVADICVAEKLPSRLAFESRMYDRINRLLARRTYLGDRAEAVIDGGISCLVLGLEIFELRHSKSIPRQQQQALASILARLSRVLREGAAANVVSGHAEEARAIAAGLVTIDRSPHFLRLAAALRLMALELIDQRDFFAAVEPPVRIAA